MSKGDGEGVEVDLELDLETVNRALLKVQAKFKTDLVSHAKQIAKPIQASTAVYSKAWDVVRKDKEIKTLLQIKNKFLVETVGPRGQKIQVLTDSAVLGKPVLLQNSVNRRIGQLERMHQMKKMARVAQKLMKYALAGASQGAMDWKNYDVSEKWLQHMADQLNNEEKAKKLRSNTACQGILGKIPVVYDPGLKGDDRIMDKAEIKYQVYSKKAKCVQGDVSQVKDISRLALQYKKPGEIATAIGRLIAYCDAHRGDQERMEIVLIENRYIEPTPLGWRDLNVLVKLFSPRYPAMDEATGQYWPRGYNYHLVELQFQLVAYVKARYEAHSHYKALRELLPKSCHLAQNEVDRVIKEIVDKLQRVTNSGAIVNLTDFKNVASSFQWTYSSVPWDLMVCLEQIEPDIPGKKKKKRQKKRKFELRQVFLRPGKVVVYKSNGDADESHALYITKGSLVEMEDQGPLKQQPAYKYIELTPQKVTQKGSVKTGEWRALLRFSTPTRDDELEMWKAAIEKAKLIEDKDTQLKIMDGVGEELLPYLQKRIFARDSEPNLRCIFVDWLSHLPSIALVRRLYDCMKMLAGKSYESAGKVERGEFADAFAHILQRSVCNTALRCLLLTFTFKEDLNNEAVESDEFGGFGDVDEAGGAADIYGELGGFQDAGGKKKKNTGKRVSGGMVITWIDRLEAALARMEQIDSTLDDYILAAVEYPGLAQMDATIATKKNQKYPFQYREAAVIEWIEGLTSGGETAMQFELTRPSEMFTEMLHDALRCKWWFANEYAKANKTKKLEEIVDIIGEEEKLGSMVKGKVTSNGRNREEPFAFVNVILALSDEDAQAALMRKFIPQLAYSEKALRNFFLTCAALQKIKLLLDTVRAIRALEDSSGRMCDHLPIVLFETIKRGRERNLQYKKAAMSENEFKLMELLLQCSCKKHTRGDTHSLEADPRFKKLIQYFAAAEDIHVDRDYLTPFVRYLLSLLSESDNQLQVLGAGSAHAAARKRKTAAEAVEEFNDGFDEDKMMMSSVANSGADSPDEVVDRAASVSSWVEVDHDLLDRTQEEIERVLFGAFQLWLETKKMKSLERLMAKFTVTDGAVRAKLKTIRPHSEHTFFDVFLPAGSDLRSALADYGSKNLQFSSECAKSIREGRMMTNADFFQPKVLELMRDRSPGDMMGTYFTFVEVALMLRKDMQNGDFRTRVSAQANAITAVNAGKKISRLKLILAEIKTRFDADPREFFESDRSYNPCQSVSSTFGMEDIVEVVEHCITASEMLENKKQREKMDKCFHHYMIEYPPASWVLQFKGAVSTAFFIKYMDRERLSEAYDEFVKQNSDAGEVFEWFAPLLEEGARRKMPEAIVDVSKIQLEERGAADKLIAEADAETMRETDPEMKLIRQVNVEWMRSMNAQMSIPMALHHTQVITVLAFAEFFKRKRNGTGPKHKDEFSGKTIDVNALIGQVGTGEGKSVVIATLALYLVLVQGKKVHILENNQSLLDRDYESFQEFFRKFRHTAGPKTGQPVTAKPSLDYDTDICYTLKSSIDQYYRDSITSNRSGFDGIVMIVDEVDDLVIDEKPTQSYVTPDAEKSGMYLKCCEAVHLKKGQPAGVSEDLWREANDAQMVAAQKTNGVDYAEVDKRYRMLDRDRGRVTNYTAAWLVYLNYRDFGKKPTYDTSFYVNSTPYIFNAYECLFGLTGSVGGTAEKNFLVRTYKAKVFKVPAFLDTCEGQRSKTPKCSGVFLQRNQKDQRLKIAEIVSRLKNRVPVLVICQTPELAQEMYDGLRSSRGVNKERLQLLLSIINKKKLANTEIRQIVDDATKNLQGRPDPDDDYRCTVTDYFGGRGLDYRMTSKEADENGGLCVIMTCIPDSEREYVQWIGRTARQDRNGHFYVILNKADDLVKQQYPKIEESGYLDMAAVGDEEQEAEEEFNQQMSNNAWLVGRGTEPKKAYQTVQAENVGAFRVKPSESKPGTYSMWVKVPPLSDRERDELAQKYQAKIQKRKANGVDRMENLVEQRRDPVNPTVIMMRIFQLHDGRYCLDQNGDSQSQKTLAELIKYYSRHTVPGTGRPLKMPDDDLASSKADRVTGQRARPAVIKMLLDVNNEKKEVTLQQQEVGIEKGMHTNEVCDMFYRKFKFDVSKWPGTDKHRELRDWLDGLRNFASQSECEAFCRQVGLDWAQRPSAS